MSFSEHYGPGKFSISLEFFPPKKQEGMARTQEIIRELAGLAPAFMTVTYGAGGSTQSFTHELTSFIHDGLKLPAVAHLTCVGHSREELADILSSFAQSGIRHILALRGDPPQNSLAFAPPPDGFSCARDLCRFIQNQGQFSCAVAGYPETHRDAQSPEADLDYLKEKVDAGAEVILTQLFFDEEFYFRFRDKATAKGISIPIVPGVMPISNVDQLTRFTSMCGASIPKILRDKLEIIRHDEEAILRFGQEEALRMSQALKKEGAPGLHLYTLNRAEQVGFVVKGIT